MAHNSNNHRNVPSWVCCCFSVKKWWL